MSPSAADIRGIHAGPVSDWLAKYVPARRRRYSS
jgi:hypothetical protein